MTQKILHTVCKRGVIKIYNCFIYVIKYLSFQNYTVRIKPGYFLASSLKYFIVQQWSLLLSEVNMGDVLVMYLRKRTEFSGGLACAIIKG